MSSETLFKSILPIADFTGTIPAHVLLKSVEFAEFSYLIPTSNVTPDPSIVVEFERDDESVTMFFVKDRKPFGGAIISLVAPELEYVNVGRSFTNAAYAEASEYVEHYMHYDKVIYKLRKSEYEGLEITEFNCRDKGVLEVIDCSKASNYEQYGIKLNSSFYMDIKKLDIEGNFLEVTMNSIQLATKLDLPYQSILTFGKLPIALDAVTYKMLSLKVYLDILNTSNIIPVANGHVPVVTIRTTKENLLTLQKMDYLK